MSWRFSITAGALALAVGLATCSEISESDRSQRLVVANEWHEQRMVLLDRPPVLRATSSEDLERAVFLAEGTDPNAYARRAEARSVNIDALPYLIGSEVGREFLQATGRRALARGEPALFCPATGLATQPDTVARGLIAREALNACIADLPQNSRNCGCRIIALDNLVTVSRDDLAYATGSSARLSIPKLGIDSLLVAEENEAGDLILRDLKGTIAIVSNGDGEEVTIRFVNGPVFKGRRIEVGFRRGRLAERIYAEAPDGERLSLLIGFEPDELADIAGAWLAWPKGG
ncbi:MAG: hypothetical protein AAF501_12395 [Pseudomonadota bacterium]